MDTLQLKSLVLATDLDGTFLGGSPVDRAALYAFIEARRADIGLVFVTGRDVAFIKTLTAEQGVPEPDLIIGDVGTTVVDGRSHARIEAVEAWVESRWDGGAHAEALLSDVSHLKPQDVVAGRRCSYFYTDEKLAHDTAKMVEAAGYDVLMSAGVFFDVLPRGVQKGPTLLKVMETLSIEPARVLVAGDTLNDLSLFETGLDGVAVANSEPALVQAVAGLPRVELAARPGAAGVHDALTARLTAFHAKGAAHGEHAKV